MIYKVDRYLRDAFDPSPDTFSIDAFLNESFQYAAAASSFSIAIAEGMPKPNQGIQAKLVQSSAISEAPLKPVQAVTLREVFPAALSQSPLKPSQGITARLLISSNITQAPTKPVQAIAVRLSLRAAIGEAPLAPSQALTGSASAPVAGFSISISEAMPASSQSVVLRLVEPLAIAEAPLKPAQALAGGVVARSSLVEVGPAPSQSLALDFSAPVAGNHIAETAPTPIQAVTLEFSEASPVQPPGPVLGRRLYVSRPEKKKPALANIRETAPAPRQRLRLEADPPAQFEASIAESGPAPLQSAAAIYGRSQRMIDEEEALLLILLEVA